MTLDFSALVTLLRRPRASSKATRATRSILARRIDLGVDAAALAVGQGLDAARLAEIDTSGELTDDHEVQALDDVALQAGGVGQRAETDGRAQVGEHPHAGAQAQQTCFRPLVAGHVGPLGAAHRTHQHRLGRLGGRQGLVAERDAELVIAAPAEGPLVERHVGRDLPPPPGAPARHFGPDPVAGQEQQVGHQS